MVSDFLGDLRCAARALGRSRGFSVLAIAIMALGIGANTAVFTVVNAVLLKPLPYPGADRIVTVTSRNVATGEINPLVNLLNFRDWRDQGSSFEAMATYRGGEAPVTPGDTAEYAQQANVDGQFFRVFAVEPILGRTFTPEELDIGGNQAAALISHAYWQSRFGGDPDVLKRMIRVGVTARPIVGVLPAGFHFPRRTDVWTNQMTRETSRTRQVFFAVGRLKQGVLLRQAQAELTAIGARLEQQYPESNQGRGVWAMGLQDVLEPRFRALLFGVFAALAVCLAMAGVYGVMAFGVQQRAKEIGLRMALGANRATVVRLILKQGFVLAAIGLAIGLAAAVAATRLVTTMLFEVKPLDIQVYAGVVVLVGVVTLLAGYLPARRAAALDPITVLKTD